MNKGYVHLIILVAFSLLILSCKSAGPIARIPLEMKSDKAIIELLKNNEFNYETFTGKANVSIQTGKKKNSIKASIRMRKDSAIWINFSYIGFAGARILLTPDSIKMINYKDENYILADINYVNTRFNIDVDFETIQSLLIGNSTPFDEDDKLKTSIDDNKYFISSMRKRRLKKGLPERRFEKLERKQEKNPDRQRYVKKQERKEEKFSDDVYSIWLDQSSNKIVRAMVVDFFNELVLTASYSDFQDSEGELFPHRVKMEVAAKDTSFISIDYSKVVKNKPVKFSFNVPSKYERIVQ